MRFIIVENHSDGFTYSCDEPIPIEYKSGEALICDFMEVAIASARKYESYFKFLDHEWNTLNYAICDEKGHLEQFTPEVLTIDEWFERNALRLQGVTCEKSKPPRLVELITALEEGKVVRNQITDIYWWELKFSVNHDGERTVISNGWKSAIEPACKPFCHMVTFPEEWEIVEKSRST